MSWAAAAYVKPLRKAPNGESVGLAEKVVMYTLADYFNDEKGYAWPSLSRLADESLLTRRGLLKVLKSLERKGLICIVRHPDSAKRVTNHYRFPGLEAPSSSTHGEVRSLATRELSSPVTRESGSLELGNPDVWTREPDSFELGNGVPSIPLSLTLSEPQKDISAGHPPDTGVRSVLKKRSPEQPKGEATYRAYAEGYVKRYRVEPVRNAKTNALLCQLVDRLGAEEAPLVAAFYVSLNTPLYVKAGHPPNLLVRDCESLRTQLKTGPPRAPMVGPKAFQSTPTMNRETMECPPEAAAALSKILGRDAFSFSADHKGPINSHTTETAVRRVVDRTERLASVQAENGVACG
jgi:hypothetical protein